MATHRTRYVTVFVPPARGAGAGSVDGVTRRPVGALTRLVAAQSPGATRAGDGAVHTLPTWRHSVRTTSSVWCLRQWYVNNISDYKTGFMVTALDILGKHQHKYLGTFISDKLLMDLMDAVIAVFYSGFIESFLTFILHDSFLLKSKNKLLKFTLKFWIQLFMTFSLCSQRSASIQMQVQTEWRTLHHCLSVYLRISVVIIVNFCYIV